MYTKIDYGDKSNGVGREISQTEQKIFIPKINAL